MRSRTSPFITITGITQDEPVTGGGSGNSAVDAQINPGGTFLLRAERAASGDGRVYHVAYTADDGFGGTCSGVVTVCVPPDQAKAKTCIDEGPLYDSTK